MPIHRPDKRAAPAPADPGAAPRRWRRRAVLAGGAAAIFLWVRYLPQLPALFAPAPGYAPIPGLAPFRSLTSQGPVTSQSGALVGVEAPGAPQGWQAWIPRVQADPCRYLFRGAGGSGGSVPVAFFTDYQCPNCRILEAELDAYGGAHPGALTLIRHELPLLGPRSVLAARARLAARMQGGSAAFEQRLTRGQFAASPQAMTAMAGALGLDPARFARDMQGPQVQDRLDQSRALAALLGFYATPGCVIGRTAFLGAVNAALLRRLIEAEAKAGPVRCAPAK